MEPIAVGDVIARVASIRAKFGVGAVTPGATGGTTTASRGDEFAATLQQTATTSTVAAPTFGADAAAPTTLGAATAGAAVQNPGAATATGQAWHRRLPDAADRWIGAIEQTARRHDLDPKLLASLVWAESGFKHDASSHAGAVGLTQLMPGTARGLNVNPHDPLQNLEGGARYLKEQLNRFGSPTLALAAYNAGPSRVAQAGGVPNIRETQTYVQRVLGYVDTLR